MANLNSLSQVETTEVPQAPLMQRLASFPGARAAMMTAIATVMAACESSGGSGQQQSAPTVSLETLRAERAEADTRLLAAVKEAEEEAKEDCDCEKDKSKLESEKQGLERLNEAYKNQRLDDKLSLERKDDKIDALHTRIEALKGVIATLESEKDDLERELYLCKNPVKCQQYQGQISKKKKQIEQQETILDTWMREGAGTRQVQTGETGLTNEGTNRPLNDCPPNVDCTQ